MALKVTYDNPMFPKGTEVEISNLGVFKNGESQDVDEETERLFKANSGKTVRDALKGDENFKVDGKAESKGGDS